MSFSEEFDSKKDKPRSSLSQLNPSRQKIGGLDICIERVYRRHHKRVAKTLQLAFNKDPFVNYILNTKISYQEHERKLIKQKNELFLAFFEFSVLEYFSYGGIIIAIKDMDFETSNNSSSDYPFLAVACWNNLKFDNTLSLDYNLTSNDTIDNKMSLQYSISFLKFSYLAYLNNCRQRSLKEKLPFITNIRDSVLINLNLSLNYRNKFDSVWYLSDVGVLPSMAGKSLGKLIINYFLDNLTDAWCYLESSNVVNRKFYDKLGFKIANTFAVNSDELVNNIDLRNKEDLDILNGLDDFILMDAMFRPPKNINIEKINWKVSEREEAVVSPITAPVAPASAIATVITPAAAPAPTPATSVAA